MMPMNELDGHLTYLTFNLYLLMMCAPICCVYNQTTDAPWKRVSLINQILQTASTEPPSVITGKTTDVTVQLYIASVDYIDHSTMDFSVTLLLRMQWEDPRLSYTRHKHELLVEINPGAIRNVWIPDIFFINSKKSRYHTVVRPNKMMVIKPHGGIFYSSRLSMVLLCEMDLRKYPFDDQVCAISMESYSHSEKHVHFHWHKKPVLLKTNIKIPLFALIAMKYSECDDAFEKLVPSYSCLKTEFYLSRDYGYYITQVYLPSGLIVCLSWVSFWLDAEATPARITLGLLTVLTMTTQTNDINKNMHTITYTKAMDVWLGVCLLFVFATLIEFAVVNYHARAEELINIALEIRKSLLPKYAASAAPPPPTALQTSSSVILSQTSVLSDFKEGEKDGSVLRRRKHTSSKAPKRKTETKFVTAPTQTLNTFTDTLAKRKSAAKTQREYYPLETARRIDRLSRWGFPLAFFIFNIMYWVFYLNWRVVVVPKTGINHTYYD